MKKTIAEQLNVIEFPFRIKDSNGNRIYYENSEGYWYKTQYNSKENIIYYEDSDKFWYKTKYNSKGNEIYYENSDKFWRKTQYDSKENIIYYEDSDKFWYKSKYDGYGNRIYYENSYGKIIDNQPKEVILSMDEIADKFGIDVKDLKVKK